MTVREYHQDGFRDFGKAMGPSQIVMRAILTLGVIALLAVVLGILRADGVL